MSDASNAKEPARAPGRQRRGASRQGALGTAGEPAAHGGHRPGVRRAREGRPGAGAGDGRAQHALGRRHRTADAAPALGLPAPGGHRGRRRAPRHSRRFQRRGRRLEDAPVARSRSSWQLLDDEARRPSRSRRRRPRRDPLPRARARGRTPPSEAKPRPVPPRPARPSARRRARSEQGSSAYAVSGRRPRRGPSLSAAVQQRVVVDARARAVAVERVRHREHAGHRDCRAAPSANSAAASISIASARVRRGSRRASARRTGRC